MPFVIRPSGATDLSAATLHAETGLPQTIAGLAAGSYQVGLVRWSPTPVAVGSAARAPTIASSTVSPSTGRNGTTFTSSYTGSGETSVTRQWHANGEPIPGATGATYRADLDGLGLLTCEVKLVNGAGSASLESAPARVDLDPAALLAGAKTALWLDPSDRSNFFVDDGVTPAAVGQTVRVWKDKSGVGALTASQAQTASRPTLALESDGRIALLFDGTDEMVLSSQIMAGGVVLGVTPSAGDSNYNHPTPLGSSTGRYITVGAGGSYRYRATSTSASVVPASKVEAQIASFNALSPNAATLGAMNVYQDGAPASDNPESKELITDLDLLGRRSSSTRFNGKCYGVVARDTPFSDQERRALQEWMGRKTWPVGSGAEYHAAGGFPLLTYVYQGA